jgi:hypothetical protein
MGINRRSGLVQSTLYACMELPQWKLLVLLMYTNSKCSTKKEINKLLSPVINNICLCFFLEIICLLPAYTKMW